MSGITKGLAGCLREKNVDVLYLVGLAVDVCVYATAMDSLREGFRTCIIEDGTRALDAGFFKTCMQQFTAKGGMVIRSAGSHLLPFIIFIAPLLPLNY